MRDRVMDRKNHYGSKAKRGTEVAALFYSLIETARLRGEEPGHYLRRAALAAIENPDAVTLPESQDRRPRPLDFPAGSGLHRNGVRRRDTTSCPWRQRLTRAPPRKKSVCTGASPTRWLHHRARKRACFSSVSACGLESSRSTTRFWTWARPIRWTYSGAAFSRCGGSTPWQAQRTRQAPRARGGAALGAGWRSSPYRHYGSRWCSARALAATAHRQAPRPRGGARRGQAPLPEVVLGMGPGHHRAPDKLHGPEVALGAGRRHGSEVALGEARFAGFSPGPSLPTENEVLSCWGACDEGALRCRAAAAGFADRLCLGARGALGDGPGAANHLHTGARLALRWTGRAMTTTSRRTSGGSPPTMRARGRPDSKRFSTGRACPWTTQRTSFASRTTRGLTRWRTISGFSGAWTRQHETAAPWSNAAKR